MPFTAGRDQRLRPPVVVGEQGLDEIIADLRRLNSLFIVFAPKIQAGFTTRLNSEQANIRKLVIRR